MNLERYDLIVDQQEEHYEFLSKGPKGTIKKVIQYSLIERNVYNLAFGDWDEINQKIDDKIRSNNNDREKVLTTVADSVVRFIQSHPEAIVTARGETPAKTRLYQMAINREGLVHNKLYRIRGFYQGSWEDFSPTRNYDAFTLTSVNNSKVNFLPL